MGTGFDVTSSQVPTYADDKVGDASLLLKGFRRMKASQDSDKETEE